MISEGFFLTEICRLGGGTVYAHGNADYLLETCPAKTRNMLSNRDSSILMMSSSVYLLFKVECPFTK